MKKKSTHVIYDESAPISGKVIAEWKNHMNQHIQQGALTKGSKVLMSSTPRQMGKSNSYHNMFAKWLKDQETENLRKQRLEKLDMIQLEKNPRKIQANKGPII